MNRRRAKPFGSSYSDIYGKMRFSSTPSGYTFRGRKYAGGAALDKVSAVAGGVGDIVNAASANAEVRDTSEVQAAINEQKNKSFDTSSYTNLLAGYDPTRLKTNWTGKDMRKNSTGQMIGNTIGAMSSGAAAGGSVGGPWGAVAGAAVGLGGSLAGIFAGKNKARKLAKKLNEAADEANKTAINNFGYATDKVTQKNAEQANANFKAEGGNLYSMIGTIGKGLGSAIGSMTSKELKPLNPYTGIVNSQVKFKDPNKGMQKFNDAMTALTGSVTSAISDFKGDKKEQPTLSDSSSQTTQSTQPIQNNAINPLSSEWLTDVKKGMQNQSNNVKLQGSFVGNNNQPYSLPNKNLQLPDFQTATPSYGSDWRNTSFKADGGYIEGREYDLSEDEIEELINEGYELEYA